MLNPGINARLQRIVLSRGSLARLYKVENGSAEIVDESFRLLDYPEAVLVCASTKRVALLLAECFNEGLLLPTARMWNGKPIMSLSDDQWLPSEAANFLVDKLTNSEPLRRSSQETVVAGLSSRVFEKIFKQSTCISVFFDGYTHYFPPNYDIEAVLAFGIAIF